MHDLNKTVKNIVQFFFRDLFLNKILFITLGVSLGKFTVNANAKLKFTTHFARKLLQTLKTASKNFLGTYYVL